MPSIWSQYIFYVHDYATGSFYIAFYTDFKLLLLHKRKSVYNILGNWNIHQHTGQLTFGDRL